MYNEHTLDLGVSEMRKQGLVQGRMLDVNMRTFDILDGAVIGTVESGEFWYGDIDMSELSKLHEVAKALGETVKVYHSSLSEPLSVSV